jgi:5-methylcytosine-specific restriction endonuclease McrA
MSKGRSKKTYTKYRRERCEQCASTNKLTVHHADGNKKNNRPENLQTLCWPCHAKKHRPGISLPMAEEPPR